MKIQKTESAATLKEQMLIALRGRPCFIRTFKTAEEKGRLSCSSTYEHKQVSSKSVYK